MALDMRRASGKGRATQVLNVLDFTGGLNLNTDTFKLKPSESPDMLNVDIDRRGGFQIRKGVNALTAAQTGELTTCAKFVADDSLGNQTEEVTLWHVTGGRTRVMQADGTMVYHTTATINDQRRRFTVFNNTLYWVSDYVSSTAKKWDGAWTSYGVSWDYTALTSDGGATWQNDLASPGSGHFVRGKLIASHMNMAWVANVYETSAYPSRVRWSHPGQAEAWRELDYIDIDVGHDNDEITALVPFSDHMLVFKNDSVHGIFGYDPNSFQVVPISQSVGTPSQESVVATDQGVYWWDSNNGLMFYDGKKVEWVGESIHQPIVDGTIPHAYMDEVHLGWVDRRVWCSVPYGAAATERTHSFVYDPKAKSWTLYDLAAGPFVNAYDLPLASIADTYRVFDLTGNDGLDDFNQSTDTHIDSHYRTAWLDMRQPAVKKRWRGMEAVLRGGADSFITVATYLDYNQADTQGSFSMSLAAGGTDMTWDTDDWDEANWASGTQFDSIVRGQGFGTARSVSLLFSGPATDNVEWGVNGFALKYQNKRVR